jgi:hypothetical protein
MTKKHVALTLKNKTNNILEKVLQSLNTEIIKQDGFFENFWTSDFVDLNKRLLDDDYQKIDAKKYLEIQGEIVFLRYIEIDLINKLQENHFSADASKQLKILKAFQNSPVYKKYLGIDGIEKKLKKSGYRRGFGKCSLEKILNEGEGEDNTFTLPVLTVTTVNQDSESSTFNTISQKLQSEQNKLQESLGLIKITDEKTQLKKLTQAILIADPMTLAMIMHSDKGKLCMAEIDSFCKKKAIEIGIYTISAVFVTAIVVILTPPLTAALPVGIIGGILLKVAISCINNYIGKEFTKFLEKSLETKELPTTARSEDKIKAINSISIDNKQSQELLKQIQFNIKETISIDVQKQRLQ